MDTIASRLRSERVRLNLTQAEMAERIGIPTATYRTYESGRSEPPLRLAGDLVKAGIDGQFVTFGHAQNRAAPEDLDWPLLAKVGQILFESMAKRPYPIDNQLFTRFFQASYGWAKAQGTSVDLREIENLCNAA